MSRLAFRRFGKSVLWATAWEVSTRGQCQSQCTATPQTLNQGAEVLRGKLALCEGAKNATSEAVPIPVHRRHQLHPNPEARDSRQFPLINSPGDVFAIL